MSNSENPFSGMWRSLFGTLKTPLALLVVLGIISSTTLNKVIPYANSESSIVFVCLSYGAFILLSIVVITGCVLAIFKPENLIYDKDANLANKGISPAYGTKDNPTKKNKDNKTVVPNE